MITISSIYILKFFDVSLMVIWLLHLLKQAVSLIPHVMNFTQLESLLPCWPLSWMFCLLTAALLQQAIPTFSRIKVNI